MREVTITQKCKLFLVAGDDAISARVLTLVADIGYPEAWNMLVTSLGLQLCVLSSGVTTFNS